MPTQGVPGPNKAQWPFRDNFNIYLDYVYGQEDMGLSSKGGEKDPSEQPVLQTTTCPWRETSSNHRDRGLSVSIAT
jgi:hypothetical protein